MNLLKLQKQPRLYFTNQDLSNILSISIKSASVLATRYVKNKIFTRLRKNFYLLSTTLLQLKNTDLFLISNLLQTPSYISFMTALGYYQITTQVNRGIIEAVSSTRSQDFSGGNWEFVYNKIQKKLYFGFERQGNLFIAKPEKALLDMLYFTSLGKYNPDFDSLDFKKFNSVKLQKLVKKFPIKTQNLFSSIYPHA